ncbi:MAG: hypothetical protein ACYC77_09735 [Coriobacteriia bacterium]
MDSKTLDNSMEASSPGDLTLSHEMMREFHPELYHEYKGFSYYLSRDAREQRFWNRRHEEHLAHGDCQPAVVMATDPLLAVAVYSDELDCVAMLTFPRFVIEKIRLQVGSRLLAVLLYSSDGELAKDLVPGPGSFGQFKNYVPLIADFLTTERALVEARKSHIPDEAWERVETLGAEYIKQHGFKVRDGRPLYVGNAAMEYVSSQPDVV